MSRLKDIIQICTLFLNSLTKLLEEVVVLDLGLMTSSEVEEEEASVE